MRPEKLVRVKLLATTKGGRIQITAPYSLQFLEKARLLGGKWKYRSRMWSFHLLKKDILLPILCTIYGRDNIDIS